MAILKFLNEISDFNAMSATTSTSVTFMEPTRVEHAYVLSPLTSFTASWPAPAGSTVWMHYVFGVDSIGSGWTTNIFSFYDASNNLVLTLDIVSGQSRWEIYGDTSPTSTHTNIINAETVYDIQFIKNGTTDVTVNVYQDGILKVNALSAANVVDFGVPVSMTANALDEISAGNGYFSECVITDEDTRGWRLRQHRVISAGVDTDWDGSINAIVDQALDTAITTNTLNDRAGFGLSNLADIPSGATIDRVALQTYAQRGATGLANFNHFFRYDTPTTSDSSDIALSLSADIFIEEFATSPNTAVAWTDTEMAGIQFGVRART